ncbi:MAG: G1 family glutamic endopeptidase, partial [Propionibacteriaceae bacterium]
PVTPSIITAVGRTIMAGKAVPNMKGLRVFPPPPKGFDALAATNRDLARHGLPQRPDPRTQPALAALWEQRAHRYQDFEHLEPELLPADKPTEPAAAGFGLSPLISCGFELFNSSGPITMLSGTWTVPNLNNSPNAGLPNDFRTFFGLGFLDVHVEMTVDADQNITSVIRIHTGAQVALPVRPGDAISALLCLQTNSAGTAFYGLVNETTSQTVNFTIDTGFPPAVAINGGISRGSQFNGRPDPLARFGVVYFDEVVAYTTNGTRLLTDGVPTTMTDFNGSTLAIPQRLNDFAFKVIYRGD